MSEISEKRLTTEDDLIDPSLAACCLCGARGCTYRVDVHSFTYGDIVIVNKFYCRDCYSTLTNIESDIRVRICKLKNDLMEVLQ